MSRGQAGAGIRPQAVLWLQGIRGRVPHPARHGSGLACRGGSDGELRSSLSIHTGRKSPNLSSCGDSESCPNCLFVCLGTWGWGQGSLAVIRSRALSMTLGNRAEDLTRAAGSPRGAAVGRVGGVAAGGGGVRLLRSRQRAYVIKTRTSANTCIHPRLPSASASAHMKLRIRFKDTVLTLALVAMT